MKLWLSKKKGTKITIHIEDEIDYKEIEYPLSINDNFYAVREHITRRLVDAAVRRWLDDNGAVLFDGFDTNDALKELKKNLLLEMIGKNATS